MSHELETIIVSGDTVASFSFAGVRKNIWHRLGQQFGTEGCAHLLMSAEEAMQAAHMDRKLRIEPIPAPDGAQWAVDEKGASTAPSYVILEGKMFMTPDGGFGNIPEKIVGIAGNQAAQGHADLAVEDRFLLAEEAIHASHGAAVWSTAGYLRDGRQGFACMEAPPIIIDPNGIADVTQSYLTVTWSYDGSRATELGSSNIRVVCANTQAMHDQSKRTLIKVKATSGAHDRMQLAAQHWANSQNEAAALALQGERMLAVTNGRKVMRVLAEKVLGLGTDATMPKRQISIRENKLQEVMALYYGPTNAGAVGDNGYAAFQTALEYLDWYAPVKGDDPTMQRVANQFDGVNDKLKLAAAAYVLAGA